MPARRLHRMSGGAVHAAVSDTVSASISHIRVNDDTADDSGSGHVDRQVQIRILYHTHARTHTQHAYIA